MLVAWLACTPLGPPGIDRRAARATPDGGAPVALAPVPELGAAPVLLEAGPLAPGLDVAFVVRNVYPGEHVYVTWSTAGPGSGRCPPKLAGACLDLVDAVELVGPGTADWSLTARVDAPWTVERPVAWLQAVVFRLDGTVARTPVLQRPVYAPDEVVVGDRALASPADAEALDGVRALTGDLTIDGLATVELPDLEQIGGSLVAWDQPELSILDLPALEILGGDLALYADPALGSLTGLSALRTIGGTLSLNRLDGLEDARGLEALRRIGGTLYVFHDVALRSLAGLDGLEVVGGPVQLWEDYALVEARLPALHTVGGKLDLFDDDALVTLELPALAHLGAYELHHCDLMAGPGEFPALRRMPGELTLQYDFALTSLDGLSRLETLGAALVRFDPLLGSLAGLSSLEEVTDTLELTGNHALPALDLPALASVGTLVVDNHDALVDPGLPALATVADGASFTDNPALSQCAIEALLARVGAPSVACAGNLDDGCTVWCAADTGDTGP